MRNYTEYHDGFFDGLWIQDEGTLQVYLRTSGKKRNTVALTGVVMLKVTGFKAGNIIFEVLTRDHNEITLQDIAELYDLPAGHEPAKWEHQLLEKARQEAFQIFELNPSYGGSCLILAHAVEFTKNDVQGAAALA